jgi:hypothetical protein
MDSTIRNTPVIASPVCPSCERTCEVGSSWKGANYCRAAVLLAYISQTPGLTTWELSQAAGMAYSDASKGLRKAREYDAMHFEPEEREQGGHRYRYFPAHDAAALERFMATLRRVEALQ